MKFILAALAAAALWVVDAQNVQTYTYYQNEAEAFATGLPNVDKGSTIVAVLGVYSDEVFQTKIGESVSTCINTGEPTQYNTPLLFSTVKHCVTQNSSSPPLQFKEPLSFKALLMRLKRIRPLLVVRVISLEPVALSMELV